MPEAVTIEKQQDRVAYAQRKVARMEECQLRLRDFIMLYQDVLYGKQAHSGLRIFEADCHLTAEITSAKGWLTGETKRLWWKQKYPDAQGS